MNSRGADVYCNKAIFIQNVDPFSPPIPDCWGNKTISQADSLKSLLRICRWFGHLLFKSQHLVPSLTISVSGVWCITRKYQFIIWVMFYSTRNLQCPFCQNYTLIINKKIEIICRTCVCTSTHVLSVILNALNFHWMPIDFLFYFVMVPH